MSEDILPLAMSISDFEFISAFQEAEDTNMHDKNTVAATSFRESALDHTISLHNQTSSKHDLDSSLQEGTLPYYLSNEAGTSSDVGRYLKLEDYECQSETKNVTGDNSLIARNLYLKLTTQEVVKSAQNDDELMKVLVTFLPDDVLLNADIDRIRRAEVCILHGRISGFIDLVEKYIKSGQGDASKLTNILNDYLYVAFQVILSHGGDVYNFFGDTFLALWKINDDTNIYEAVHDAIDSALQIKGQYCNFPVEPGVFIRTQFTVTTGSVLLAIVGNRTNASYIMIGEPVWDIQIASEKSALFVIISPNAWNYVDDEEYIIQYANDGQHVIVLDFASAWQPVIKVDTTNPGKFVKCGDQGESPNISFLPISSLEGIVTLSGDTLNVESMDYHRYYRPFIAKAIERNTVEALRRFIPSIVTKAIEAAEPFEYLADMRQISIMMVSIEPISCFDLPGLINLAKHVYDITSSTVADSCGQIIKLTFWNRQLDICVIFGTGSVKHDLEVKKSLRCAQRLRVSLPKLDYTKTVAIALTTGTVYTGVVGHQLRLDYAVMGEVVNRAFNLVHSNYSGRVLCDKETLICSKFHAKYFELVAITALEGYVLGQVYEYDGNKDVVIERVNEAIGKYPLLGRNHLIAFYLDVLSSATLVTDGRPARRLGIPLTTGVLFNGPEARIGKTKFLDEICHVTPPVYSITRIALTLLDSDKPFHLTGLIMGRVLGLEQTLSIRERELRILDFLKPLRIPQLLCGLNPIFNVNFELSPHYLTMTDDRQVDIQKKLIHLLCRAVTGKLFLLFVDDLEFMDNESISMLSIILETDIVFIVMTFGSKRNVTNISDILDHPNLKAVVLPGIDCWYQTALTCQILGVWAIPHELERIIQNQSRGNPGWICCFLLSLLQTGGITIKKIKRNDATAHGLVLAPPEMMVRIEWKKGYFTASSGKCYSAPSPDWNVFESCYNEEQHEILNQFVEKIFYKMKNNIRVAMLSPHFEPDECDPNLTPEVMLMMTFGTLSQFEQSICESCAVLGHTISRRTLLFVLNHLDNSFVAKAIAKLFDINILGCSMNRTAGAVADALNWHKLYTSNNTEMKCNCPNLKVPMVCYVLPQYAYCENLQFKIPMFRETVYALMNTNLKREYHLRALNWLEMQARRCISCGGGLFYRIFSGNNSKSKSTMLKDNIELENPTISIKLIDKGTKPNFLRLSKMEESVDNCVSSLTSMRSADELCFSGGSFIRNDTLPLSNMVTPDRRIICGLTTSPYAHTSKSVISLAASFASTDFEHCFCTQILLKLYSQAVEHCKGINEPIKLVDICLQYAVVCIVSSNASRSVTLLQECEEILVNLSYDPKSNASALYGKINTLLGYSFLALGKIELAYLKLIKALDCYGHCFPTTSTLAWFLSRYEMIKLKFMVDQGPLPETSYSYHKALMYDETAECMSVMCSMYKTLRMWRLAEYAAIKALQLAIKSNSDFFVMCSAYTNMLDISYHYGNTAFSWWLEKSALLMVGNRKNTDMVTNDLFSVGRLYCAVFISRVVRCELIHAIRLGYKTMCFISSIQAMSLRLVIIPILIECLISRILIPDAVRLLFELEHAANDDSDQSAITWFYALCTDIYIDTGYTVVTTEECKKFLRDQKTLACIRDPDAEKRLFADLWLLCVRLGDWEGATLLEQRAREALYLMEDDSVANVITCCRLLEGYIISLVNKINTKDIIAVSQCFNDIKSIISTVRRSLKITKYVRPRFTMLVSYFRKIYYNNESARMFLKEAIALADSSQMLLIADICRHIERSWNAQIHTYVDNIWLNNALTGQHIDCYEIFNNQDKIFPYIFPLPQIAENPG